MSAVRPNNFKGLWAAAGDLDDAPLKALVRVSLVTSLISVAILPLAGSAFVAALFLHLRVFFTLGLLILAAGAASWALREVFRIRLALDRGQWPGWGSQPIQRQVQPGGFWAWTALWAVMGAIPAATALALVWSALKG